MKLIFVVYVIRVVLATTGGPECFAASGYCTRTFGSGCVSDNNGEYVRCFGDDDGRTLSPHDGFSQGYDMRCPNQFTSSEAALNMTLTSVNPEQYDITVQWDTQWDTQGETALHCLKITDEDDRYTFYCVCSDRQGHDTISLLKYNDYQEENTYTVQLINLDEYNAPIPGSAVRTTYLVPKSCRDERISFNPDHCGPPRYGAVRNVTYSTTLTLDGQMDIVLSWEHPSQSEDYGAPTKYYVKVTDQNATQQDDCNGGNPVCFLTDKATTRVTNLNSSQTYSINVQPYVPCSGMDIRIGSARKKNGCGSYVDITNISYRPTESPPSPQPTTPSVVTSFTSTSTDPPTRATTPIANPSAAISVAAVSIPLTVIVGTIILILIAVVVSILVYRTKLSAVQLKISPYNRGAIVLGESVSSNSTMESQNSNFTLDFQPIKPQVGMRHAVIIYSLNTPKNELDIIHHHLLGKLSRIDGIILMCYENTSNISENEWVDQVIQNADAVLCVINKEFLDDWEGKGSSYHPLIKTLSTIISGEQTQPKMMLSAKYAVIRLKDIYDDYIPTKLRSCKNIEITNTDDIGRFIMHVPPIVVQK